MRDHQLRSGGSLATHPEGGWKGMEEDEELSMSMLMSEPGVWLGGS